MNHLDKNSAPIERQIYDVKDPIIKEFINGLIIARNYIPPTCIDRDIKNFKNVGKETFDIVNILKNDWLEIISKQHPKTILEESIYYALSHISFFFHEQIQIRSKDQFKLHKIPKILYDGLESLAHIKKLYSENLANIESIKINFTTKNEKGYEEFNTETITGQQIINLIINSINNKDLNQSKKDKNKVINKRNSIQHSERADPRPKFRKAYYEILQLFFEQEIAPLNFKSKAAFEFLIGTHAIHLNLIDYIPPRDEIFTPKELDKHIKKTVKSQFEKAFKRTKEKP